MKKLMVISMFAVVAGLLFASSAAQAYVLDDFEDNVDNWIIQDSTRALSTAQYYAPAGGSSSLEVISDTQVDLFGVHSDENHWDQSALKTTYVEVALRLEPPSEFGQGTSTWLGNDRAMMLYIGSNADQRECWRIDHSVFEDIAPDANGWYVLHLELDDSGHSINTGATLNGTNVAGEVVDWTTGIVDWEKIDYARFYIYRVSDATQPKLYIDQLTLGEAVPEPATMVLLGLGGVGLLIRRRRRA